MFQQTVSVVLVAWLLGATAFSTNRASRQAPYTEEEQYSSSSSSTSIPEFLFSSSTLDTSPTYYYYSYHSASYSPSYSAHSTSPIPPSGGCLPPLLGLNGTRSELTRDEDDTRMRNDYTRIREVKFSGAIGPLGEKRLCKIKCVGGQWVGPLCVNQQDGGRFHPLFRSCHLEHINPHLVVTFRNVSINNPDGWSFPHGAKLMVRCRELGLYKLLGDANPTCQNGAWSNRLPSCVPTTMLTNFTEDAPPTVLIRIPAGSASVEPSGVLAVYPGSTVHLECLFSRRLGSPDWTWTSPLGQYLTGWAIATEEREWKYRLSVYYTKPQDSGTFTCATPRGITNSITLHVTAVNCEKIRLADTRLSMRVEGERLGHRAFFQCPVGYKLEGIANLTCQASGKWSAPPPKCAPVRCPPLDATSILLSSDPDEEPSLPPTSSDAISTLNPHLHLEEHNASYGGRAVFRCAWGFRMLGPPGIECELDGRWSGPPPSCVAIQCPPPVVPVAGRMLDGGAVATPDGGKYAVGSLVQFSCNDGYQLEGEASIVCTETGFWSHPPPFCNPRCSYPGEPENGFIIPIKFSYEPGDMLQVTCNPGYESRLEERPKCLPNGNWSLPLPLCTSYEEI